MSISAQQAAQQLNDLLINLLSDRHCPYHLNKRLAKDLKLCGFPEVPIDFEGSFVFFNKFFAEISHPSVVSFGWSRGPILFPNILLAIKKSGDRLRAFRRIIRMCKEHFQFEALFAVMCEAIHHPVGYYERFNSQNAKDFMRKGMIMLRIEQRRHFPPGPNCKLTYLFHFSLDEILKMMKRKNGMSGYEDTRSHMVKSLMTYNSEWNDQYSAPIRCLLRSTPNFFSIFKSDLEILYRNISEQQTRASFWLGLIETKTFRFYNALHNAGIYQEAMIWILNWYVRYRHDHYSEPTQGQESFNELMTRIVQLGEIAFPFKNPPRLFKKDCEIFKAALNWSSVPTSDIEEICYRSHTKGKYGLVPSQCIIAASIRRKLHKVKITKAAVKIQKMARRAMCQIYLKRLIAALIIKKRVLQFVTPILRVKKSMLLILSTVKRFFIQEKFFEKLECYRYVQEIKAGCVIFKVLNRLNHVREYQKIRACSIIQSRLIALTERQEANARIKLLKAASTISRFAKLQHAAIVHKRLQKFVKDLCWNDCPICLDCLNSVPIGMIQPCGHIHCKTCFAQISNCSNCRAEIKLKDCKSVGTFLSQSNPKFFFTTGNSEKKTAIAVIIRWWVMKRRLNAPI